MAGGSAGPPPACDDAGIRRAATPAEMAQYCLCTAMGEDELVWECYGPSPSAPKPQATCAYTTVNPGSGQGSCSVTWENCSDGKVYGVLCIESYCQCTVQGMASTQLGPMQTCPEDKGTLDSLCGWDLH
jgi:hypothetical protein